MLYKITWLEEKTTSTGKKKYTVSIVDADGKQNKDDVTIWEDYPRFAELRPGSMVEGDLVPAKDPKYGPTLYPPRAPKSSNSAPGRTKAIEVAQERKAGYVAQAQANKEQSIQLAAAFRDATLIALAESNAKGFDRKEFQDSWLYWRQWLTERQGDTPEDIANPF